MNVTIHDVDRGPFATVACGSRCEISFFGAASKVIARLMTPHGSVSVQHERDCLIEFAPKVAALYGMEIESATIRSAIEVGKAALAAHESEEVDDDQELLR
jgi:hypothetical protein